MTNLFSCDHEPDPEGAHAVDGGRRDAGPAAVPPRVKITKSSVFPGRYVIELGDQKFIARPEDARELFAVLGETLDEDVP